MGPGVAARAPAADFGAERESDGEKSRESDQVHILRILVMSPTANVMEGKVATANQGMAFAFLQCRECLAIQLGACQEAGPPLHLRARASGQHQRVSLSVLLPHDAQLADPRAQRLAIPGLVVACAIADHVDVDVNGRVSEQAVVLAGKTVEVVASAVGADKVRIAGNRTFTAAVSTSG